MSNTGQMRALIIEESLRRGEWQLHLPPQHLRRYAYRLDGRLDVTIAEYLVPSHDCAQLAIDLAEALAPSGFYAHLVDASRMVICFPDCVVVVRRDDDESAERAKRIGEVFSIPRRQMRFIEMFYRDHPDCEALTTQE
jgi:hypothetical protein